MRYDDASGAFQASGPIANDDADTLGAGERGPATGNLITGEGTQYGAAGADSAAGAHITAIAGKGGEDSSFAAGKLSVAGEHGRLTVDADGNYSYLANGNVENVRDRFTYTLADNAGNSDTAALIVEIGKTPAVIKADAQQIVPGPDGVVTLPPGVDLSDVHVVGRNLVIDMPDGTQLVIIDGAIFVPQLVLGGVEVPATNVAALLIGQEVQPAAGETPPSSGGNFALPPPPLDPGIPLGDLIPPTEYNYIPPEPQEVFDILDEEPEAGAATAQLDDDAQDDGNPGGVGDDPGTDIAEGTLPGSGGDGALTWDLLPAGSLPNGTFSFADQLNGDVWILQNGIHVLTVSVDPLNGDYTVTQVAPIDHPAGSDENNLEFVINYNVVDQDGDIAQGTLTVNVDDDTPVAVVEGQVTGLVDEDDLPAGNKDDADGDDDPGNADGDNDGTTTAGAAGSLSGLFSFGADQPGTLGLGTNTSGMTAQGLTSNGVALTYAVVGDTLTASAGGETIFTLTVNADGSWSFDLEGQLDHSVADTEDNLDIDFSSMIVGTDHDGDTATLPDDTFVITVDDDLPVAVREGQVTGLVDEDDLPAGNHDNADGDDDPGNADGDGDGTTTGGDAGSLSGLFSFGADQPGTVILSEDTSELPALTSNGATVTYSVQGNVLTASAGGSTVFTLTVNPDGSWVFDLEGQLDHSIAGTEDNLFLDFSSIIIGVDADGDTAALPPESFVVNVDDDMPQEFEECPDDVITVNDPDADTFTGNLNLPPVGADDPGVVTFGVADGDPVLDNADNPITSGGVALFYFINEDGVLEARAGDANGEVIFTITLNGDGTFTYDQLGVIGEGGEFTFNDLTSTSAGNVEFRGVGADDPATTVDLLLSADDNGTDTSVNTDSDSIGSANQSMDDGETVRIDFVSDLTSGAGTPSGFGYTGHVSSSSFLGVIPQVQGNQDETVAFTVWALDSNVAQGTEPDRNPAGGFSDSTITQITDVTVKDYLTGESTTVDVTGYAVGVFTPVAYGISVRVNADGSVTFSGIQQGDSYGFNTDGGEFTAVAVQADPAGTGGSTEDSFDLGVFSIGTTTEFEPVDLTVPIVLTDADGDPVVCDIDIHIGPPLDVDDITVTVNEAGLDLIGSDPLSDSETQGGDLQGQVSGGTGPYTFAFAAGEDGNGTYGTLTLNPDGTFSYTLDTPFDTQPDADDGTNPELGKDSFDVIATDSEGATQTLTIFVNIIDDVPSIDVTAADDSEVELLTQDAETIGGLSDTDSSSADFSGVFGFTAVEGADGAAVTPDLDYALGLSDPGGESGLEQGGDPIYLYLIDGKVVGSTSAVEGDVDASNTVFDVAVSATGVVTLTQYSQIDHPLEGGLNDAPFDDQVIALADGLVTLTASASIVDNDGDTDQDSETVNIGANLQFADHGPIANNDVDSVVGGFDPATGNVLTGTEVSVGEDTNGTDGVADNVGADTPGRITNIDHDASPAEVVPDGGSVSIQGDYGVLTIYSNGDYSYQRDPGTPGGVEDVFTYTLTDYDGDTDTATLTIGIDDNFPTLPDPDLVRLDDDVIPGANGNLNGPGDDDPDTVPGNVANGQLNGTGGDGDLDYAFTGVNTLPTGFSIGAASDADTLIIVQDQNGSPVTVMTIQLTLETGAFTVTQNAPMWHPADNGGAEDNIENNFVFSIGVEVEDADGDTEPATITVNVDDDTPTINVTKGDDSGVTLTTDDAQTIGGASDTAVSTANFSGVFGLNQSAGADGTAAAATLQYTLDVTGYTGPAGVDSGLNQGGNNIYLYEIGGKVVGSTAATLGSVDAGNTVFDVGVDGSGIVTLTQYSQIDHVGGDPTPTGSPFADHIVSLSDSLVTLTASSSLTDRDGDTVTDSETANIGANLRFTDDGPSAAIAETGQSVSVDESVGIQLDSNDTTAPAVIALFAGVSNTGTDTDLPQYAQNASAVVNSTGSAYGADGAGTTVFSLNVSAAGVDSGLNTTSGQDILLYKEGSLIVGRVSGGSDDGKAAFAVAIDPVTGVVSTVEYLSIQHLNAADPDDSVSIADGAILAVVTVTDFDGDTATQQVGIGSAIQFQDSAPVMTAVQNMNIQNSGDVANTAQFAFNLGADGANISTNDVITNVTGSATVGGVAVQNWTLTPGVENATTASYTFDFDYPIGGGNTAHATGTLVFDKVAGTYTVDLVNPIQGVTTILQTAQGTLFQGYEFGTSNLDGSQPEISVTQIQDLAGTANDIYVQFTSVSEPSSGTGDNNLEVFTWTPGGDNPAPVNGGGDTAWNAGQLFNQVDGWVSTSNSANGVDGDTIQGGEVLDFTLVQGANPTGNLAQPAAFAQASAMFLKFDGIGASEDMIVVLKLYDPNTNTYTTRAIMIENSDIQKGPGAGPGQYSGVTLDNNDGLVIIESNDYNNPGENWVIVGAQIAGSDEGVTGTAINLNSAIGAAGDSDVDNNGSLDTDALGFQSDTDDGPFKISSIGFLTTQTTPQNAQLDFNVTVTDGDGDSITQAISATVTAAADSTSAATIPAGNTTINSSLPPEPVGSDSFSSSNLSFSNDNSKLGGYGNGFGNIGNTGITSAMAAAYGFAMMSSTALNSISQTSYDALVQDGFQQLSTQMVGRESVGGEDFSSLSLDSQFGGSVVDAVNLASSGISFEDHGFVSRGLEAVSFGDAQPAYVPNYASGEPAAVGVAAFAANVPAVSMASADMLMAAGLDGNAQHGGAVEQVLADALGSHAPTIDAVLANLPGGIAELSPLADLASGNEAGVPAWDMGMHGAFAQSHDMLFKVAAVVVHQDAVQPA